MLLLTLNEPKAKSGFSNDYADKVTFRVQSTNALFGQLHIPYLYNSP